MDNWSETDCRSTPETLFDFLLRSVQSYYKYLAIVDHEKLTKTDEKRIGIICQGYLKKMERDRTKKELLKILTAPVVLILTILVWVASGILYCSAFVFGLAGTVLGLLDLAVLLAYSA